ncbi:MAG: transcription antitermination factor NusB [Acidobacteria bacterium]|nr:transcription antitermination factor NusB [Acidobacteriota bacterium]
MAGRRKARELALQLLFQEEVTRYPRGEISEVFWRSQSADEESREFAEHLFQESLEHRERIDELIRRHSEHWRFERIAAVDRNILRMAVCEFLYTDTPRIVAIDEAIEIARRFSGEQSTEFVNGVLDAIKQELEAQEEQ